MTSRGFSSAIDSPDSTTRNYIDGRAKPGADYLEKLVRRYTHVNLAWLLTGQGEMFLSSSHAAEPRVTYQRSTGGQNQNIGTNDGKAEQVTVEDCQKELNLAQQTIKQLRSQLTDKERIIQLLESQPKK